METKEVQAFRTQRKEGKKRKLSGKSEKTASNVKSSVARDLWGRDGKLKAGKRRSTTVAWERKTTPI